jgi:Domain of Unknown Function (DUF1206)
METSDLRSAAARAGDSPALENAARLGYAVSGVLHLLIGWLGIQLAWLGGGQSADQSGALQQLASTPTGRIILWLAVVGFLGLGVWQLTEAIVGRGQGSDRAKAAAKAGVYLFLAFSSFSWARTEGGSSSSQQSVDFTASLMDKPAGRILVGALGLAVIAVGAYHVYKGWTKRFVQDLRDHPGEWVVRAGRFGYIAKGVALGLVGVLFLLAAIRGAAEEATGLDGALHKLLEAPYGQWLLTLVSLGFASYAVYSFARARYARV